MAKQSDNWEYLVALCTHLAKVVQIVYLGSHCSVKVLKSNSPQMSLKDSNIYLSFPYVYFIALCYCCLYEFGDLFFKNYCNCATLLDTF